MGQAPSGDSYNDRAEGLPLIAGAGDFAGERPQVKKFTTSPSKSCAAGDIVLGIRASIGAKVWADGEYCLGRGVAGLRPGAELHDRYLWHWLTHSAPTLSAKGRGATFLQVNRADVSELVIPLPALDEQRRIAAILDQADALRAKRRQALTRLDSLTQSIFVDMFGNPVSNERGWPMGRLSELGTLDRGVSKHRPRNDPSLLGGTHPLIQTGDVANSGGYITTFTSTYSDLGLAQSKIWPVGTLCITIAANIARTGVLEFEACFPDSVVGFSSDPDTVAYVQVWLGFLQAALEEAAPQSAQKNINLAVLRGLEVPEPEPELMRAFAQRIHALKRQRALLLATQRVEDEFLSSLQSRSFRGDL